MAASSNLLAQSSLMDGGHRGFGRLRFALAGFKCVWKPGSRSVIGKTVLFILSGGSRTSDPRSEYGPSFPRNGVMDDMVDCAPDRSSLSNCCFTQAMAVERTLAPGVGGSGSYVRELWKSSLRSDMSCLLLLAQSRNMPLCAEHPIHARGKCCTQMNRIAEL